MKSDAEIRFEHFVKEVKAAKTDYDIAKAGLDLVEKYRGFNYQWHYVAVSEIIKKMFKKKGK
jgi:hypothetical protein